MFKLNGNSKKINKAYVSNVIKSYANIGKQDKTDTRSTIKFNKLDKSIDTRDDHTTIKDKYDVNIPSINKVKKHTKSLSNMVVKDSEYNRNKRANEDESVVYDRNKLNISITKTDTLAKSTIKLTRVTMGQIHNMTMLNVGNSTSFINRLSRFDYEITYKFYNNTIENINILTDNIQKLNNSIESNVRTTQKNIRSNFLKEQNESLIYVDKMFALGELSKKIEDVIKMNTLGMSMDTIKSFIDVGISSPVSMAITALIKKMIPKDISDALKNIESIPTNLATALGLQFNSMKKNDNPLISWIGDKLIPTSVARKTPYKQGVISFDTYSKVALTKNIPTLLSYWLQAADPVTYRDGLVYDYETGRFVKQSTVDKYFKRFDFSGRLNNIRDANDRRSRLKEEAENYNRFSINDVKFNRDLANDYHIYSGRKQDAYYEHEYERMFNNAKDKLQRKSQSRFKLVRNVSDWINNKANIIDNYLFGEMDIESAVNRAADSFFTFKDSNLVKKGKLVAKNAFNNIMEYIFLPMTNTIVGLIDKGKTVIGDMINRVIHNIDEHVYPIIGIHLGKGFIPSVIEKTKDYLNEKIVQPLKNQAKKLNQKVFKKFQSSVRTIAKWVNEQTESLKADRKVYNNFSNVLADVKTITEADTANLKFFGLPKTESNIYTPKSITFSLRDNTIINKTVESYSKSVAYANDVINRIADNLLMFADINKSYIKLMKDSAIRIYESSIALTHDERVERETTFNLVKEMSKYTEEENAKLDRDELRKAIRLHNLYDVTDTINNNAKGIVSLVRKTVNHKIGTLLTGVLKVGGVGLGYIVGNKVLDKLAGHTLMSFLGIPAPVAGLYAMTTVFGAKNTVKGIIKVGTWAAKRAVGLAGMAANAFLFTKTLRMRATMKVLEVGSKYLLPAINTITRVVGPHLIHMAGTTARGILHASAFIGKNAMKAMIKVKGTLFRFKAWTISTMFGMGLSLINKVFNRKKSGDDTHRYHATIVGGQLDFIQDPVATQEVMSAIKYDDDQDEINANENIAKKNKLTIGGRIAKRMAFVNKVMWAGIDKVLDYATEGFVNVTSFILGGTVGGFLAEQGGKVSQDVEDYGYENVYIVGGSVNGGVLGNIADTALDEGIDAATSGGKVKKVASKATGFLKKHKKGVAIAAVTTALVALSAKKAFGQEKQPEEIEQPEELEDQYVQVERENVKPYNEEKTGKTISQVVNQGSNKSIIQKAFETLGGSIIQKSTGDDPSKVLKSSKDISKANEEKITKAYKASINAQRNSTKKRKQRQEQQYASEIKKVPTLYGDNHHSISTTINGTDTSNVNVDDMVREYRNYTARDNSSETKLYNSLNKRERSMYDLQDSGKVITNSFLVNKDIVKDSGKKKGFLGTIGSFLINVGKTIFGGIIGGIGAVLKAGINVGKLLFRAVDKFTGGGLSKIFDSLKNKLSPVTNWFKKVGNKLTDIKDKVANWFKKKFSWGKKGATTKEEENNIGGTNDNQLGTQIPSAGGYIWPTPGHTRISSPFGMRIHPIKKVPKMHTGIDISAPGGAAIVAVKDGVVSRRTSSSTGYGNFTIVDHGDGYQSAYAHQSRFAVNQGDRVKQGQIIGYVGTTGSSTGNHLHFEIRKGEEKLDPTQFVSASSSTSNADRSKVIIPEGLGKSHKVLSNADIVYDPNTMKNEKVVKNSDIVYQNPVAKNDENPKNDPANIDTDTGTGGNLAMKKSTTNTMMDLYTDTSKYKNTKNNVTNNVTATNKVIDFDEYRNQKILRSKNTVKNYNRQTKSGDNTDKYAQLLELLLRFDELMEGYREKDKKITIVDCISEYTNTDMSNMIAEADDNMKQIPDNVISITRGI